MASLFKSSSLSCVSRPQRAAARPAPFTAHKASRKVAVKVVADAAAAPVTSGVEKSGPNFPAAKDIDAIMKTLPHR